MRNGNKSAPPEAVEGFEIESLNADNLSIEELEARLEMAASIMDLGLYCGANNPCPAVCECACAEACCGPNCGAFCSDCATFCSSDCSVLNCFDGPTIGSDPES